MNDGMPIIDTSAVKLSLDALDLWGEWYDERAWRLSELRLDTYALLSQMDRDDAGGFEGMLQVSGVGALSYEGIAINDVSRYLSDAYRIARVFKKREWGVVLFTFDGPDSPFARKMDVGPDVKPFFEGDMKEAFTEAAIVYLGPQMEKGPYADYGPVLDPLKYPYVATGTWEPDCWAL